MNDWKPILIFLIDNKEKLFTINQIAKALRINYRIAYTETQSLQNEGLIDIAKAGNSNQCKFSGKFNDKIFSVETERRERLFNNKDLKLIYHKLKIIDEQFILILFGSYAKNKQTRHSDIDLLLISNNYKKIESELNLLPHKIHLTAIKYEEFIHMLKSKEFSVVSEAIKNNIIFFGIEDYYRMLQNAQ